MWLSKPSFVKCLSMLSKCNRRKLGYICASTFGAWNALLAHFIITISLSNSLFVFMYLFALLFHYSVLSLICCFRQPRHLLDEFTFLSANGFSFLRFASADASCLSLSCPVHSRTWLSFHVSTFQKTSISLNSFWYYLFALLQIICFLILSILLFLAYFACYTSLRIFIH